MDSLPILIITTAPVTEAVIRSIEETIRNTSKVPGIQNAPVKVICDESDLPTNVLACIGFNIGHQPLFWLMQNRHFPSAGMYESILMTERRTQFLESAVTNVIDKFYLEIGNESHD